MKYLLLTLWLILMVFLSHQGGEATSRESLELAEKLRFLHVPVDKMNMMLRRGAHIFLFFVLGCLWIWCFGVNILLIIPAILSWLDEATKPLIPGRHYSLFDTGLNLLGFLLAVIFIILL